MSMEEIEITEYTEPTKTGFVGAIKKGFRGYVVWNARSTRAEYWWWTLFAIIVAAALAIMIAVVYLVVSRRGGLGAGGDGDDDGGTDTP